MKLILALILAAGMAHGQTTVNITNSLIGPVTQNFSNTQVNVSQAVITGAVVNASVTGVVVEASITNSFAPVNNVTNDVSISNVVNVGNTIVNNTNSFSTVITNNVQVDVAGVIITNIIENIVQSNNYFTTITGAVISVNSATGAVTLTVSNTTNSAGVASWSGTVLSIGTNVSAGGGGISHWASETGTSTRAGSFLYATSQVPANITNALGLFIGTNVSISFTRPDGTVSGGNAPGANTVTLVPGRTAANRVARSDQSVVIGYNAGMLGTLTEAVAIGAGATIGVDAGVGERSIAIGSGASAGTGGNNAVGIGRSASSASDSVAIGPFSAASAQYSVSIGGNAGQGGVGAYSLSLGGGEPAGTRFARSTADRAGAIGFRAKGISFGSVIIADGVDEDKNTQGGSNTITFAFNRGAYFTQTNTVYAAITRTNFVHSGFAGLTVTQRFLDATSTIRTNIFVGGILVTGYTE